MFYQSAIRPISHPTAALDRIELQLSKWIRAKEKSDARHQQSADNRPELHGAQATPGDSFWPGEDAEETPSAPPITATVDDSIKNCSKMSLRRAPSALERRSPASVPVTETSTIDYDDDAADDQRDGSDGDGDGKTNR